MSGRVVVITGASARAGIGAASAEHLGKQVRIPFAVSPGAHDRVVTCYGSIAGDPELPN